MDDEKTIAERRAKNECYICHKVGHWPEECPDMPAPHEWVQVFVLELVHEGWPEERRERLFGTRAELLAEVEDLLGMLQDREENEVPPSDEGGILIRTRVMNRQNAEAMGLKFDPSEWYEKPDQKHEGKGRILPFKRRKSDEEEA